MTLSTQRIKQLNNNDGSREASKEVPSQRNNSKIEDIIKGQVVVKLIIIGQQKRIVVAGHHCQVNHHNIRVKKVQRKSTVIIVLIIPVAHTIVRRCDRSHKFSCPAKSI